MTGRAIALLLALVMAIGGGAPALAAADDGAALVDDRAARDPAIVVSPIALGGLAPHASSAIATPPPAVLHGRRHGPSVFRPPRAVTSR